MALFVSLCKEGTATVLFKNGSFVLYLLLVWTAVWTVQDEFIAIIPLAIIFHDECGTYCM